MSENQQPEVPRRSGDGPGVGYCVACGKPVVPAAGAIERARCPRDGNDLIIPAGPGMPVALGATWNHNLLVRDLATWLISDGFITSEVKYGPSWTARSPIPDVLKIRKSYTRVDVQIYEVKVSRPDFLSDIRSGKWQDYLKRSTRLYFATPASGVVNDENEVPRSCGWITRGKTGWKVRRPPEIRSVEPSYDEVLALLMSEHERATRLARELTAERARKHRHNLRANSTMKERMRKIEDILRRRRENRHIERDILAELRESTGLPISRSGWRHDLQRWLERQKDGGLTKSDLRAIRGAANDILMRVNELDPAGKPAQKPTADGTTAITLEWG